MKKLILEFKRWLRKGAKVEVWDTSAISTWFDEFTKSVNTGLVEVIVPEGVEHELSKGRRNHENCRVAHNYIKSNKISKINPNGKIKVYVTDDNMRSWPIDEQVVGIAAKHYKKGYNVTLVTCDRNQSDKAQDMEIEVCLLAGNRAYPVKPKILTERPERFQRKPETTIPQAKDQISVPCVAKGNMIYIDVNQKVAVYDAKGRRKIGKDDLIPVTASDTYKYREATYQAASITKKELTLKKMDST